MPSTADTWVPHAAADPPVPLLSLPVHRASGSLRGDRGEGIEDRSDLCAHQWCKGYGVHRQSAIGAGAWQAGRNQSRDQGA
jgi:hypothetical protein